MITSPPMTFFGVTITGPTATPVAKYLLVASFVAVFALVAKNLARGRIGRNWMAIRDMDIAAELIGVRPLVAKTIRFCGFVILYRHGRSIVISRSGLVRPNLPKPLILTSRFWYCL